jgi:putative membrane protein insertion efficiency factor
MTLHGLLAPGPLNRQFPGRMLSLAMSGILRGAIRAYQLTLAYFFVGACRYEPSCSAYAAEAVARHGALKGSLLAAHRLCRCAPWGGQGYDPVPPAVPARPSLSCSPAKVR